MLASEMTAPVHHAPLRVIVPVFLVALGVQGLHLLTSRSDPTHRIPIIDAQVYHDAAVRFARGEPLADGAFWQPPLLPAMLGALYRFTGPEVIYAQTLLALMAAGSCALVAVIGAMVFSPQVGLLAGFIAAVHGPWVFYGTQLLPVGPAVFLELLAMVLLFRAVLRPNWPRWTAFGVCTGLAVTNVPNAGVLLLVALGWLAFRLARRPRAPHSLPGGVAPVAPVAVRNYRASGEVVLLSTNGGMNFYIANSRDAEELLAIRPGEYWTRLARSAFERGARTRVEQSRTFTRMAGEDIRADPVRFAGRLSRRLHQVISAREIPRNIDVYTHRDFSPLLTMLVWRIGSFAFPFGVLAPLALLGCTATRPSRSESPTQRTMANLLGWFIVLYLCSVALFFVSSRHRMPAVMAMIPLAAAGLHALGTRFLARGLEWWHLWCSHPRAERPLPDGRGSAGIRYTVSETAVARRRIPVSWMAVLVLTGVVVNLPTRAPTDGVNFRSELYTHVGNELRLRGRLDDAENALQRAIALEPGNAVAIARVAALRAVRGETEQAERLYRLALGADPRSAEHRLMLGDLLARTDRLADARDLFAEAVERDPYNADAHAALARAEEELGHHEGACAHYGRSIELGGGDPAMLVRYAGALRGAGRYEEAIEMYRLALWRLEPDADTCKAIADLLLNCPEQGLRDCARAGDLAEHAARLTNNRDAEALELLAAAHAMCGDTDRAIDTARRAERAARDAGDEEHAERIRRRREQYEAMSEAVRP
jgi:tetratricopeptide (TPR) repeat protein